MQLLTQVMENLNAKKAQNLTLKTSESELKDGMQLPQATPTKVGITHAPFGHHTSNHSYSAGSVPPT
jgi:hypothetical protein